MEKLISVIVPIYKVENYLDKCIESIVAQTYKSLEIILVDDGSPDRCPEMCDEWAKRDSRIRVIHKKNGGLSDARNAGIDAASGDFISFIDSDDYIAPGTYERLTDAIESAGADMCIFGFQKVDENGSFIEEDSEIRDELLSRDEAFSRINEWPYVMSQTKLYNREIFSSLRFPVGKLHEDEFVIHRAVGECQRVVAVSDKLYYYFQRSDSIMGNFTDPKHLDGALAFLDRYEYHKNSGRRALAARSLNLAYGALVVFLDRVDMPLPAPRLSEVYRYIIKKLILSADLRAVKLFLMYRKCMSRLKAKGKGI